MAIPKDDERVAERQQLGAAIRSRRKELGQRLADVGASAGVSVSLLSHVERGLHDPSLESLRAIAEALDTAPFHLLATGQGPSGVVRGGAGRRLALPDSDIEYELLSPSMDGAFEITRWALRAGGESSARMRAHAGAEATLILEGRVEFETEDTRYELSPGDCLTLGPATAHRFVALGGAPAAGVSVVSPPSF